MGHQTLTETDFFKRISNGETNCSSDIDIQAHYNEFVEVAVSLCHGHGNANDIYATLAFTEIELQYCRHVEGTVFDIYAKKALSFIRRMMRHYMQTAHHGNQPYHNDSTTGTQPTMRWTGKASDLVELLYGIDEMNCINNGDTPLKDIAAFFYKTLGVDAKECYRIYADMKLRKSESRTYFIDKMGERVNRRMEMDEERERMRR